jgi:uncharacterized pyridoxamine 5'-phosphate oxidase family protein
VYDFLKKAETFYLATADGDQPQVRPFSKLDIFEDGLYFQTGKVKTISGQLAANPKVAICAYKDDNWLRVTATAVEDDRDEARQHMLDTNPDLKDWYAAGDGNSQVFRLRDATAKFESFFGEPREIKF